METPRYSRLREAQAKAACAFNRRLAVALSMSDYYDVLNAEWLAEETTVERIVQEFRMAWRLYQQDNARCER